MAVLSNSGISSGSIVETTHITQIIDAFTGVKEYDITLSGSLTLTGSLNFSIIPNNIQGTSSTSTTSSHSITSLSSSFAYTSSGALNETVILTLTHSPINLTSSLSYYVGGSNITTTVSSSGLNFLEKYTLQKVRIAALSTTTGSSGVNCGVSIYKNFIKVYNFSNNITYNSPTSMLRQSDINLVINTGDIISFELEPAGVGTLPTGVTHNFQLYLVIT